MSICVKSCLVCDLEDFDFFNLEIPPTREKDNLIQSGVIRVSDAKASATVNICVAVIGNSNVIKVWTSFGITNDCPILHFVLQRKSPRPDIVRILQRENKTPQTVIRL
jgi:hypothetical protein